MSSSVDIAVAQIAGGMSISPDTWEITGLVGQGTGSGAVKMDTKTRDQLKRLLNSEIDDIVASKSGSSDSNFQAQSKATIHGFKVIRDIPFSALEKYGKVKAWDASEKFEDPSFNATEHGELRPPAIIRIEDAFRLMEADIAKDSDFAVNPSTGKPYKRENVEVKLNLVSYVKDCPASRLMPMDVVREAIARGKAPPAHKWSEIVLTDSGYCLDPVIATAIAEGLAGTPAGSALKLRTATQRLKETGSPAVGLEAMADLAQVISGLKPEVYENIINKFHSVAV